MPLRATRVPDAGSPDAKLWLIGEAPGATEERERRPFIGDSGMLLMNVLSLYGIKRDDVFISNLCPFRPDNNDFKHCIGTIQLEENLERLDKLREKHKPNCVLALGRHALNFLSGTSHSITNLRGYLNEWKGTKLIATYHPAAVLREYSLYPIFAYDVLSAIREAKHPDLAYDTVNIIVDPRDGNLVETFAGKEYLSVDIETTKGALDLLCIGFGHEWTGLVLPFTAYNDLWIRRLLESDAKKIFHHGAFDVNVLRAKGYLVNNVTDDTIIQAHVLEPELPRSLEYLTSIYVRVPHYKFEGKFPEDDKSWSNTRSKEDLYSYNAKDAIVTYQIFLQQLQELKNNKLERLYRYEMESLLASIDMSQTGLLLDIERRDFFKTELEKKLKENYVYLGAVAGRFVNPRSPKDVQKYLYEELKLPQRTKRGGKVTSDEDALVSLLGYCKGKIATLVKESSIEEWKFKLAAVKLILIIRGLEKLLSSYINITSSPDNRVRSLYKVHGTETGRWSAAKFVDDTGLNLQTIPRESIEL